MLKILKYISVGAAILTGLVALVILLLYLPPVQRFIKNRAVSYVSDNFGILLEIERLRIRFPLRVTIDNAVALTPERDTLLRLERLAADIHLMPLLRQEVKADGLLLENAAFNFANNRSGLRINTSLDNFTAVLLNFHWKRHIIAAAEAELHGATVGLSLGEGSPAPENGVDTTSGAPWRIEVGKLKLTGTDFRMTSPPRIESIAVLLGEGEFERCAVDLGTRNISATRARLYNGDYALYFTGEPASGEPSAAASRENEASGQSSEPWTITVGKVELNENSAKYVVSGMGSERAGFDPRNIEVSGLNLAAESFHNRRSDISVRIKSLSFRERSGLEVAGLSAWLQADSSSVTLSGFELRTPYSDIAADAWAGASLSGFSEETPVTVSLNGTAGMQDILLFYQATPQLRRALDGRTVTVGADIDGRINDLTVNSLSVLLPGHISLEASGRISSITRPATLDTDLRLNGVFTGMDFIKPLIPDTALRNRIGFPGRMTVAGTVRASRGSYSPDLIVTAGEGRLAVRGSINMRTENYEAHVTAENFPVHSFLPHDSLGLASLSLSARGAGFDPRIENARSEIKLSVDRFDYRQSTYKNILLEAALNDHMVSGTFASSMDAMYTDIVFRGEVRPEAYSATITGDIRRFDPYGLRLVNSPLSVSLTVDASASFVPGGAFVAELTLDSIHYASSSLNTAIEKTTVTVSADSSSVKAHALSGDMTLDFASAVSFTSFKDGIQASVDQVKNQIKSADVNMALIQDALPPFSLRAEAGRNNILNTLLGERMSFNHLAVSALTDDEPFHARIYLNGFKTGNLTLDSLNVGLMRRDGQLAYYARLRNNPGNIDQMALIAVRGSIEGNRIRADFLQRDRADSTGFRFGLQGILQDSSLNVSIDPLDPIFGYERWTVNEDNYLTWHFGDRILNANIRLDAGAKRVYIQSAELPNISRGAINLNMVEIDIGKALRLLPNPPALGGTLDTDVTFGFERNTIAAEGSVGLSEFSFGGENVGNVSLAGSFLSDSAGTYRLDASLSLDDRTVLTAGGVYTTEGDGNMDFTAKISEFPLDYARIFLPADMVNISGQLGGDFTLRGSPSEPDLNGRLALAGAEVTVKPIGTTFRISPDDIVVDRSSIIFNRYAILSPDNKTLTLDGHLDIGKLKHIQTDLDIYAEEFDIINSTQRGGSQIYGKAMADIDIRVSGGQETLTVRGDIGLLGTSNIYYTMRSAPLRVENRQQNIVTFISFADTAAVAVAPSAAGRTGAWGMDVLVNIDIERGFKATVNLSEGGNNRAELTGEGNLTYILNPRGDSRFTGRYNLTGGTFVYNPPIISPANFAIQENSYVEWRGELANPSFNVTAVDTRRMTVTMDNGATSTVNFEIIVRMSNTLSDLSLLFDLAAPGNATIQNQLSALSPQERSSQALSIIIFNTYTGPGASARLDTNNPINTFIQDELNKWARSNLRGVDLSFGITTQEGLSAGALQHVNYTYRVSKSLFDERVRITVGGGVRPTGNDGNDPWDDFVSDISIEYQIRRRENIFLRFYRYNAQESILEGEVIKTGVGLVIRRKLNRLRDLFRFSGVEQRREERIRRREVRRELRYAEQKTEDAAKTQRQDESEIIIPLSVY